MASARSIKRRGMLQSSGLDGEAVGHRPIHATYGRYRRRCALYSDGRKFRRPIIRDFCMTELRRTSVCLDPTSLATARHRFTSTGWCADITIGREQDTLTFIQDPHDSILEGCTSQIDLALKHIDIQ